MRVRSIRRELVVWISAGLLVAIAIAAIGTYLRTREEANEIFDYQLKQMSSSLTGVPLAGAPPLPPHRIEPDGLARFIRNCPCNSSTILVSAERYWAAVAN